LPFKKGAFHVAIASQAPIQPIIVSRYYFLDDTKKLFNPGMVTNKSHQQTFTLFGRNSLVENCSAVDTDTVERT
jgi:1-acyl-sn-glycerol-3-phosphate acyltransferase